MNKNTRRHNRKEILDMSNGMSFDKLSEQMQNPNIPVQWFSM